MWQTVFRAVPLFGGVAIAVAAVSALHQAVDGQWWVPELATMLAGGFLFFAIWGLTTAGLMIAFRRLGLSDGD